MTDALLLITAYLLFGLAFAMFLSKFDGVEDGAPFWFAFTSVVLMWPLFVVLVAHAFWRHRRARR